MTNQLKALQAILSPSELDQSLYPPTSRYHAIPVKTMTRSDGKQSSYLARRFVPQPDQFTTLHEHYVSQGERIDNLAANYIGDPEQFWRIADANYELDPQQLTAEVGNLIRITLPEGIPGAPTHHA